MDEAVVVNRSIEAKIVILGEQNVGKTSFVFVFDSNSLHQPEGTVKTFDGNHINRVSSTIGASFVTCRVRVKDKSVCMQIWDTAGQERFRSMAPLYYRKANAAVVMYDVSEHSSFRAAKLWILELKRNVEAPVLILLVGNKADLCDQRVISYEDGFSYAASVGALFCETSAITEKGVCEAFFMLAQSLVAYEEQYSNFEYKLKAGDYVHLSSDDDTDGSNRSPSSTTCCSS